jgi:acetylglutamate kinase
MIRARALTRTTKDPDSNIERVLDLGFVGEPEHVDVRVIHALTDSGLVPVIAPVGVGADGRTYNINAETVAGAIAGALKATRLLMLTDVAGVLDNDSRLIPELSLSDVEAGIQSGMIPKVENCVEAVRSGAKGA